MSELLSVDQALASILQTVTPVNAIEKVPLASAHQRILAQDAISPVNVPPADNSAMDGYAVNSQDLGTQSPQRFRISQRITAGSPAKPLTQNTAARIFTGGEIPSGADAVIMQEQCEVDGDFIILPTKINSGNNIRRQGQDIQKNTVVVNQGQLLAPQHIGLLASIGLAHVPVYRQLTVAILSTGDELVEPGESLKPGQIYNSNRYLLNSFLQQLNIKVIDLKAVDDNLAATEAVLKKAQDADCILSTGGVSVGEEDHIKQAVNNLGELKLWRIAMKPGKPLAFGSIGKTPFFGLPGNPVSAFTTFLLFVRPFLQTLQGQEFKPVSPQRFIADFDMKSNPIRQEYIRVKRKGNKVIAYNNQSSGVLSSTAWADGLAIMLPQKDIKKNENVDVILFNDLF